MADENKATKTRRSGRIEVAIEVLCRSSTTLVEGWVFNLAPEGCAIYLNFKGLHRDQPVRLKFGGLEYLSARVQWRRGRFVGIEFDRPLYGPIHDHLIRQFALLDDGGDHSAENPSAEMSEPN